MNEGNINEQTHTIRLELKDEPGALLRALEPIAENGGNLLSIFHERGNVTPRGLIPVEVDIEASAERYRAIIDGLRDAGINVVQAGRERYSESITVILTGHIIDTGISDTLTRIREETNTSIKELSLGAPDGTQDVSSARLRLGVTAGEKERTLDHLRTIADEKDLNIIEPLIFEGDA